ncbi:MAG: dTMP kinase [Candidatus Hydrogenedentes bacterium]|nr:dTMP kinase [Candidatus Hydrogenedentota bacterium]
MFISMDGTEGCGKTTQTRMLAQWCRDNGYECIVTREPGGTPLGERVRDILLDPAFSVEPMTELFLYLADRAEHVRNVVRPALDRGLWVISDRFMDSTTAYQGCGRGLGLDFVDLLNRRAVDGIEPDITFIFDVDVAEGLARARQVSRLNTRTGGDRIESDTVQFHNRVAQGFLDIAARSPDRVALISSGSIEEVHRAVISRLTTFIEERAG